MPTKVTVLSNYQKYHLFETSCNRNKGNSSCCRMTRTSENMQWVHEILETDPTVSACHSSSRLPKTCFNKITHLHLRWHPYMIQVNHQLLPGGFQRQIDFYTWFLERLEAFLRFLAIGDEVSFQINGMVTNRNVRCYTPKHYPHWNTPSLNQCQGRKFQCGLGPFFFKGNINGEAYLHMLNNQIVLALAEHYVLQANSTFLKV